MSDYPIPCQVDNEPGLIHGCEVRQKDGAVMYLLITRNKDKSAPFDFVPADQVQCEMDLTFKGERIPCK